MNSAIATAKTDGWTPDAERDTSPNGAGGREYSINCYDYGARAAGAGASSELVSS
jgi:hypothetical protein